MAYLSAKTSERKAKAKRRVVRIRYDDHVNGIGSFNFVRQSNRSVEKYCILIE